MLILMKDPY